MLTSALTKVAMHTTFLTFSSFSSSFVFLSLFSSCFPFSVLQSWSISCPISYPSQNQKYSFLLRSSYTPEGYMYSTQFQLAISEWRSFIVTPSPCPNCFATGGPSQTLPLFNCSTLSLNLGSIAWGKPEITLILRNYVHKANETTTSLDSRVGSENTQHLLEVSRERSTPCLLTGQQKSCAQ